MCRGNNIGLNQIHQILGALVEKMTNDGQGVPIGKICYRTRDEKLAKTNVMASIPCGVCPRSDQLFYTGWHHLFSKVARFLDESFVLI